MPEVGIRKIRQGLLACCVAAALAFCSAVAMGAIADSPTSNTAYAATKFKSAKIVDAGDKSKTVTKKTINMALVGRSSTTLKVDYLPKKGAVKSVKWYSSSKKVATVSSKGKVVAKKKGTATIKAKLKMHKGKSRTFYAKVKVTEGGWQKTGKVEKKSTCTATGITTYKSLDGWTSKKVTTPKVAHKFGSDSKCTVCGAAAPASTSNQSAAGQKIAKTAVQLATGAQDSKKGNVNPSTGLGDYLIGTELGDLKKSSSKFASTYNIVHDKYLGSNKKYPDCGYSVILSVLSAGADSSFKSKGTNVNGIKTYLDSSSAQKKGWKQVGTYKAGKYTAKSGSSKLQPGDVLVYNPKKSNNSGNHARIYVGYDAVKAKYSDVASSKNASKAKNGLWFVDSSQGTARYPFASYSKKGDEKSSGSRTFIVYRLCA